MSTTINGATTSLVPTHLPMPSPAVRPSLFPNTIFHYYTGRLQFRQKVMGGTPRDPAMIIGWLKKSGGFVDEDDLNRKVIQTMRQNGIEFPDLPELLTEQDKERVDNAVDAALADIALKDHTNGFKKDHIGLYLETRTLKAGFREATNILFAGDRWKGPDQKGSGKGPRSFFAENVFVDSLPMFGSTNPDNIYLTRENEQGDFEPVQRPDGVELMLCHVDGPQGRMSSLGLVEYVLQPVCSILVMASRDAIKSEHWQMIWEQLQEIGWGADRSQGFGRFNTFEWQHHGTRKPV